MEARYEGHGRGGADPDEPPAKISQSACSRGSQKRESDTSPEELKRDVEELKRDLKQLKHTLSHEQSIVPDPELTEMMKIMQWTEVTEDDVLKLESSFPWMSGTTIYVRQVYKRLHELISKAPRDVIVTGNPGIGKSYFAVYELYLAVRGGKNVVYQQHNTTWCFQPKQGCAFLSVDERRSSVITELLRDPSTVFLYDCATREVVKGQGFRKARLVVVSSPEQQNYKEIEKGPKTRSYYMPVWSRDELALCYKNVYDECQQKMYVEWEEKYRMFGGIPRYTFTDPEEAETHIVNLHQACDSCTPEALTTRLTNRFHADVSHMVFKLEAPTDNPTLPNIMLDFASKYVEDRVYQAIKKGKHQMRRSFLSKALDTTLFAGISARLFGEEAHKILRQGGWFILKNLKTKKQMNVKLSETRLTTFYNLSEVDLTKSENYWQPLAKNFPSVDVTGPDVMSLGEVKPKAFQSSQVNAIAYQMTIAKCHGIKESGLSRLHREHGITHLWLVFVVPKVIFESFGEQSLEGKGQTPLTVELEQYALCVDIEEYVNKYY